ncbi:MAG: alpha-L-rhamnosidase [Lentisphaerae bacterium]|nr:alpha-L-rhamnosidase [Lentisphaerota bacterium]
MSKLISGIRDPRVIDYIPVKRVVVSSGVENPEFFVGKTLTQPSEHLREGEKMVVKAGSFVVLDFGMELTGGVRIVTGRGQSRCHLVFGESVSEAMSEPDQCHSLHDLETLLPEMGATEIGNTGFRFVRIEALTDIPVASVMAMYRHLDIEAVGSLECSDPLLQRIWDVCVHTVFLNMQEYILDGVKRDRLVWMGDMHPEVTVINYIFGNQPVVKKSLDYIRNRAPLPEYMNSISSYSLWWVICHWDLYMHFADIEYLKEQKEYLKALMRQLGDFIAADGREILPETRFIDWPTRGDDAAVHAGLQALMIRAFGAAEKIAVVLEDPEFAGFCKEKYTLLKSYKVPPTSRKAPNALLALAGAADAVKVNEQILSVDPYCDLGTFMGFYTLSARAEAGDYEGVLNTIRKYYGAMLEFGATSFWEDFDMNWLENATPIDEPPVPGKRDLHAESGSFCFQGYRHSLCHGWSGGPTALLIKMLCGLEIVEPGFKRVRLKPKCVDLDYFRCAIPTPQGILRVSCQKGEPPRFELPRGIALAL